MIHIKLLTLQCEKNTITPGSNAKTIHRLSC